MNATTHKTPLIESENRSPAGGKAPLSALLLDVELKLAALDLAASRGLDPDRPKGLKKVTPTI